MQSKAVLPNQSRECRLRRRASTCLQLSISSQKKSRSLKKQNQLFKRATVSKRYLSKKRAKYKLKRIKLNANNSKTITNPKKPNQLLQNHRVTIDLKNNPWNRNQSKRTDLRKRGSKNQENHHLNHHHHHLVALLPSQTCNIGCKSWENKQATIRVIQSTDKGTRWLSNSRELIASLERTSSVIGWARSSRKKTCVCSRCVCSRCAGRRNSRSNTAIDVDLIAINLHCMLISNHKSVLISNHKSVLISNHKSVVFVSKSRRIYSYVKFDY